MSSFEQLLQQWIAIDNQLQALNEKSRLLREQKHQLSDQLNEHLKAKQLQNIAVRVGDERVRFGQAKETQPLTFKYLETCLSKILDVDAEQIGTIIDYIKQNRENKYVMEIKRLK